MKRGEIWTGAGGADYAGKPRPFVIVQDDVFADRDSLILVPFTTDDQDLPDFRIDVEPSSENGLRAPCKMMVDKMTAMPKSKLGERVGALSDADTTRLNRSLLVFLGLAA
jgi:mRNA interferase MazF